MNAYMYQAMMEPVVLMERKRVSDGAGGFMSGPWEETAEFEANIWFDSSTNARRAEAEGVTSVYTITTSIYADLQFYDVFKRISDGSIFRITSKTKDIITPKNASFQFAQFKAESWELTT